MNLAAALYAADVRFDAVKRQLEALLTTLFSSWQSWDFHPPDGLEVWQAPDSDRAAMVLHARGFVSVTLHGHRAERFLSCDCKVRERPSG